MDRKNEEKIALAQQALEESVTSLWESLDDIEVGIPPFFALEKYDPGIQRQMKLQAIWMQYGQKICQNAGVRQLGSESAVSRRVALVCAIGDLLGFHGSLSVAALIVKEGLQTWCDKYW